MDVDINILPPPDFHDRPNLEPENNKWTMVKSRSSGRLRDTAMHDGGGGIFGALNANVELDRPNVYYLKTDGKIIIVIEPSNDSSLLFNSEVRKQVILSSVIGDYVRCIKNIRLSRDKSKLILELTNRNIPEEKVKQFYEIRMLGDCHVQCRKSKQKPDVLLGVIQGYHQMSSINSVIEDLKIQNFRFRKVHRMMKNSDGEKIPTALVLVEFLNLERLPKRVYVDFCEYRIRSFEPEPVRCFKCQRFNHLARNCTSNVDVCAKCSEHHTTKDCNRENQPGTSSDSLVKCFNCKGEHPAYSKDCSKYKK